MTVSKQLVDILYINVKLLFTFNNFYYVCPQIKTIQNMNIGRFFFFFLFPMFLSAQEQHFKKDSVSGVYQYIGVWDIPNTSKVDLYKRLKSSGFVQAEKYVRFDTEEKIMQQYTIQLANFKFAQFTETFDIKDGKVRWTIGDIQFLHNVSKLSKFKPAEEVEVEAFFPRLNEILTSSMVDFKRKIVDPVSAKSDW
ncbi:MAG: hypothetical protein POELPBGB_02945 [Bacteroidia bacterium]|nr:hypothetical protein [Bacteroidia bacterium]